MSGDLSRGFLLLLPVLSAAGTAVVYGLGLPEAWLLAMTVAVGVIAFGGRALVIALRDRGGPGAGPPRPPGHSRVGV